MPVTLVYFDFEVITSSFQMSQSLGYRISAVELCITPQKSTAYNFPLKYDSKLYRQNTDYVKMVLDRKIQMQPSVMTDVHD